MSEKDESEQFHQKEISESVSNAKQKDSKAVERRKSTENKRVSISEIESVKRNASLLERRPSLKCTSSESVHENLLRRNSQPAVDTEKKSKAPGLRRRSTISESGTTTIIRRISKRNSQLEPVKPTRTSLLDRDFPPIQNFPIEESASPRVSLTISLKEKSPEKTENNPTPKAETSNEPDEKISDKTENDKSHVRESIISLKGNKKKVRQKRPSNSSRHSIISNGGQPEVTNRASLNKQNPRSSVTSQQGPSNNKTSVSSKPRSSISRIPTVLARKSTGSIRDTPRSLQETSLRRSSSKKRISQGDVANVLYRRTSLQNKDVVRRASSVGERKRNTVTDELVKNRNRRSILDEQTHHKPKVKTVALVNNMSNTRFANNYPPKKNKSFTKFIAVNHKQNQARYIRSESSGGIKPLIFSAASKQEMQQNNFMPLFGVSIYGLKPRINAFDTADLTRRSSLSHNMSNQLLVRDRFREKSRLDCVSTNSLDKCDDWENLSHFDMNSLRPNSLPFNWDRLYELSDQCKPLSTKLELPLPPSHKERSSSHPNLKRSINRVTFQNNSNKEKKVNSGLPTKTIKKQIQ